jgi:hypothetical protein
MNAVFWFDVLPSGFGLIVTLLLGCACGWVVDHAVRITPPEWLNLGRRHGPDVLGLLERVFFFSTLWAGQPAGVAAWFVFKVAAKWNAWTMLGELDEKLGGENPTDRARSRTEWGAFITNRFLIGTLYNVLCGVIGAVAGWVVIRLCRGGLAL